MKPPPILIVHSDPRDLAKLAAILTEGRYNVLQATGYPEAAASLPGIVAGWWSCRPFRRATRTATSS